MGLNDRITTDTTAEPPEPKLRVSAFKNTPPGQEAELKEDVNLIGVNEQDLALLEDENNRDKVAIESILIKISDIAHIEQTLLGLGGISQSVALECAAIVPEIVSDKRPIAGYSKFIANPGYSEALEEVQQQNKSVFVKFKEIIARILQRIKAFISKIFNGNRKPGDLAKASDAVAKEVKTAPEDKVAEAFAEHIARSTGEEKVTQAVQEAKTVKKAIEDGQSKQAQDDQKKITAIIQNAIKNGTSDYQAKLVSMWGDQAARTVCFYGNRNNSSKLQEFGALIERIDIRALAKNPTATKTAADDLATRVTKLDADIASVDFNDELKNVIGSLIGKATGYYVTGEHSRLDVLFGNCIQVIGEQMSHVEQIVAGSEDAEQVTAVQALVNAMSAALDKIMVMLRAHSLYYAEQKKAFSGRLRGAAATESIDLNTVQPVVSAPPAAVSVEDDEELSNEVMQAAAALESLMTQPWPQPSPSITFTGRSKLFAALEDDSEEKKSGFVARIKDFIKKVIERIRAFATSLFKLNKEKITATASKKDEVVKEGKSNPEKAKAVDEALGNKEKAVKEKPANAGNSEFGVFSSFSERQLRLVLLGQDRTHREDIRRITDVIRTKAFAGWMSSEFNQEDLDAVQKAFGELESLAGSYNVKNDMAELQKAVSGNSSRFGEFGVFITNTGSLSDSVNFVSDALKQFEREIDKITDQEKLKIVQATCKILGSYLNFISQFNTANDKYNKFVIDAWNAGNAATESFVEPVVGGKALKPEPAQVPSGAALYASPLSNESGLILAAGAALPNIGGFAEYHISPPMAQALDGAVSPSGTIVVDPRRELVARIQTLQQALANLDRNSEVVDAALEEIASEMPPIAALKLRSNFSTMSFDNKEFEQAVRARGDELTTRLLKEFEKTKVNQTPFGSQGFLFGSAAKSRAVTVQDIDAIKKYMNAETAGLVAGLGQARPFGTIVEAATCIEKTIRQDIFKPGAFLAAFDSYNKVGVKIGEFSNTYFVEDAEQAYMDIANSTLGNPPRLYKGGEHVWTKFADSAAAIEFFMEKRLSVYIEIATEKGYARDLEYFNYVKELYGYMKNACAYCMTLLWNYFNASKFVK